MQTQDNYHLTENGLAVRQQAEQTTNEIFYAPWTVLLPAELETVQSSLSVFQSTS
jgi:hypothetical protein